MRSKNAIMNVSSTLVMNIVSIICGFIIPKMIIEHYGSNINGLVNSITQFLGYISLLEIGIGPIIISLLYKPISNNDKSKIETILFASQKFFKRIGYIFIIYLVVLLFLYPFIVKNDFDFLFTSLLILIISLSTFFEYFIGMSYRLFLEASQKKYIINFINISTTFLNSIIIILLIKINLSIHIVKLLSSLIFIARPLFLNIYVKRKYKLKLSKKNSDYTIKNKKDGFSLHIAGIIFSRADIVLLTIFSNIKFVSIYAVYNLVVTGINNLTISFSSGIGSAFGDMIAKKEKDNLIKKFRVYENLYLSLLVIIISCMVTLILPFIKIYTANITDANYYRPVFAYILCLETLFYLIKVPYESLCYAGGYFKEIKKGGWIEAFLNLSLSLILVFKFNLEGIAIGTMISVLFRMSELVIFTNKKILESNVSTSTKKIFKTLICILINVTMMHLIITKLGAPTSYSKLFIVACIVGIFSSIMTLLFNIKIFKETINYLKNIIHKGA